jgi:hypothetical protein
MVDGGELAADQSQATGPLVGLVLDSDPADFRIVPRLEFEPTG